METLEKTHYTYTTKKGEIRTRAYRGVSISKGKNIFAEAADLDWFEFIHRHGHLPTPFLLKVTERKRTYYKWTMDRLKNLRCEEKSEYKGQTLFLPYQQEETRRWERNPHTHGITPLAIKELQSEGRYHKNAPIVTNNWWHDLGVASITASLDLAIRDNPEYSYVYHDEIVDRLERQSFPVSYTYQLKNGQKITTPKPVLLKPDRFAGIFYKPENQLRTLCIEFDRNTESKSSDNPEYKNHYHNLLQYLELGRRQKEFFGDNIRLAVLMVFSMPDKMHDAMNALNDIRGGKGCKFILFKCWPGFSGRGKKPSPPKLDLFTDPWERAGLSPFSLTTLNGEVK